MTTQTTQRTQTRDVLVIDTAAGGTTVFSGCVMFNSSNLRRGCVPDRGGYVVHGCVCSGQHR